MHLSAHLVRSLLDHHEDFPEAGAEQQPALRVAPGGRRHADDWCCALAEACRQLRLLNLAQLVHSYDRLTSQQRVTPP